MKRVLLKADTTADGKKRTVILKQVPREGDWGFGLDVDASAAAEELAYKAATVSELSAPDFNVFLFVEVL
jgi:hypothetical protein